MSANLRLDSSVGMFRRDQWIVVIFYNKIKLKTTNIWKRSWTLSIKSISDLVCGFQIDDPYFKMNLTIVK